MAHPHLRMRLKALQKRILGIKFLEVGTPVFPRIGFLHLAAQSVRHKLRTIANAQHRHLAQKLTQIHFKRLRIVHRKRRTRKNHANHRIVAHRKLIVGQNFAKRVKFANASTNQLSGLRTEIQDNNFLLHGKGLGGYDYKFPHKVTHIFPIKKITHPQISKSRKFPHLQPLIFNFQIF